MANYNFKGDAYALPYEAPGFVILKKRINIPELIANQAYGQELVDDNGNVLSLPSTGFSNTNSDILRVFKVPVGTLITVCGALVVTVEGGAATFDFGDGDDPNGFLAAVNLNSAVSELTQVADGYGPDNVSGVLYDAEDSLDITWGTDATAVAVFDIFAMACKVY